MMAGGGSTRNSRSANPNNDGPASLHFQKARPRVSDGSEGHIAGRAAIEANRPRSRFRCRRAVISGESGTRSRRRSFRLFRRDSNLPIYLHYEAVIEPCFFKSREAQGLSARAIGTPYPRKKTDAFSNQFL